MEQAGVSKASTFEVDMRHPKINSAKAIDDHTLLIEFDNFAKKIYDIRPLLEKEMFSPLRNFAFFNINLYNYNKHFLKNKCTFHTSRY